VKGRKYPLSMGVVALAAVLFVGYSAVAAQADLPPAPTGAPTIWPQNASGMTYGSGADAKSLEDEPDLICVQATNGEVGYAYRTDLEGTEPSSPAEALAQQREQGDNPRAIPVYETDGVTQIGVFVIQYGEVETIY